MDKFLEIQSLPGLDHAEIENKNRNINSKEIESVIKTIIKVSTKKLDLMASPVNSMKHGSNINLSQTFHKNLKRRGYFLTHYLKHYPKPKPDKDTKGKLQTNIFYEH